MKLLGEHLRVAVTTFLDLPRGHRASLPLLLNAVAVAALFAAVAWAGLCLP